MGQVKRYSSFEEIKSFDETGSVVDASRIMHRHEAFERLVKSIYAAKFQDKHLCNPKEFEWQVVNYKIG